MHAYATCNVTKNSKQRPTKLLAPKKERNSNEATLALVLKLLQLPELSPAPI